MSGIGSQQELSARILVLNSQKTALEIQQTALNQRLQAASVSPENDKLLSKLDREIASLPGDMADLEASLEKARQHRREEGRIAELTGRIKAHQDKLDDCKRRRAALLPELQQKKEEQATCKRDLAELATRLQAINQELQHKTLQLTMAITGAAPGGPSEEKSPLVESKPKSLPVPMPGMADLEVLQAEILALGRQKTTLEEQRTQLKSRVESLAAAPKQRGFIAELDAQIAVLTQRIERETKHIEEAEDEESREDHTKRLNKVKASFTEYQAKRDEALAKLEETSGKHSDCQRELTTLEARITAISEEMEQKRLQLTVAAAGRAAPPKSPADADELKHAQDEIAQLRTALEESEQVVAQFTAAAPVPVIPGGPAPLAYSAENAAASEAALAKLRTECERAARALAEKDATLEQVRAAHDRVVLTLREKEAALQQAQSAADQTASALRLTQSNHAQLQTAHQKMSSELREKSDELRTLSTKYEAMATQVQQLNSEKDRLSQQLTASGAALTELRAEGERAAARALAEKDATLEQVRAAHDRVVLTLREKEAALQQSDQKLSEELRGRRDELRLLNAKHETDKQQWISKAKRDDSNFSAMMARQTELSQQLATSEATLAALRAEVAEKNATLQQIEAEQKSPQPMKQQPQEEREGQAHGHSADDDRLQERKIQITGELNKYLKRYRENSKYHAFLLLFSCIINPDQQDYRVVSVLNIIQWMNEADNETALDQRASQCVSAVSKTSTLSLTDHKTVLFSKLKPKHEKGKNGYDTTLFGTIERIMTKNGIA